MIVAATLAAMIVAEPVRYRRGRVRRYYRVERKAEPPKQEAPALPAGELRIDMIKPIINPNTFRDRFDALPRVKGDRER